MLTVTVSVNNTIEGQVLTSCYYGDEEMYRTGFFPPVLIFVEWNIFGFINSIDFVTKTHPFFLVIFSFAVTQYVC